MALGVGRGYFFWIETTPHPLIPEQHNEVGSVDNRLLLHLESGLNSAFPISTFLLSRYVVLGLRHSELSVVGNGYFTLWVMSSNLIISQEI